MQLIEETITRTERILEKFKNPAMLVSFGKDSSVMLHLFRHLRLPVICHQHPLATDAHAALQIAKLRRDGIPVHDYPPSAVNLVKGANGDIGLASSYQVGRDKGHCLVQTFIPPTSDPIPCGLYDYLSTPVGTFAAPWDILLLAQKNGDSDRLGGTVIIGMDVLQYPGSASFAFPLCDWTDANVAAYISAFGITLGDHYSAPGNNSVPEPKKGRHPDFIAACTNCLNPSNKEVVFCPRVNGTINNVSAQAPWMSRP